MPKKIRILFDISHGVYGTTGIQQDMKRVLSALLESDRFEIDYLVYDMINNVKYNLFAVKKNVKKYGKLVAQSRLLDYYFHPAGEDVFSGRIKGRILRKLYKIHLINRKKPEVITLDKSFNEALYQKLLNNDNNNHTLDKFKQSNVHMAIFSREGIIEGFMQNYYKPPILQTESYDIVIFFQDLPIEISKNTVKVIRNYDLIQILSPDVVFKADYVSNYQYRSIQTCINQGAYFSTISNTVANQIKDIFSQDVKTHFIPVAISNVFKPKKNSFNIATYAKMYLINPTKKSKFKFNQQLPEKPFDYFLSVSTIEPRKNILSTYQAFKQLKFQNKQYQNLKLVLVGKIGWNLDNTYQNMFMDEDVIVLSNVPTSDLPYLYSNAKALVFVPFQEGFGVPPAEAMACGIPVILSDIPVHREIHGGGEPFFVNHYNIDDIADKMKFVLDEKNKSDLDKRIKAGLKHVKKYSIAETGRQWREFLISVLN